MLLYHWVILCTEGSKESASSHVDKRGLSSRFQIFIFVKACFLNEIEDDIILVSISNGFFSPTLFLQRLPFTLGFLGCMVGTIYVSMVLHSYILSVLFSVLQVS